MSSASIVDCAASSCGPTLKMIGALVSVTMYNGVDLALSGLLPQLASRLITCKRKRLHSLVWRMMLALVATKLTRNRHASAQDEEIS